MPLNPGSPVEERLGQPLREYWLDRVRNHLHDSYAGISMSKFPEDLRVYEHLLWQSRANVVIEIGTQYGGSALWFRDRLFAMRRYFAGPEPHVISLDVDNEAAVENLGRADRKYRETITLLKGDVSDPGLAQQVRRRLPRKARCLVTEDSAHIFATTEAALVNYSDFVPVGGYFVVEDGCVDIDTMRPTDDWPRGVRPALDQWLATKQGSHFRSRRDLEMYGVTCHPRGFLQRES